MEAGVIMTEITIKLLLILVLAGFIGWDREKQGRPAGFRTHILVGIGSTLIMIVSINIYKSFPGSEADPARIAAQVVSGIGFLGAGTILIQGSIVKGLTTAASLWTIAAIGLAVGGGYYYLSIAATVIVFIALFFLSNVEHGKTKIVSQILVCKMQYDKDIYQKLTKKIEDESIDIKELNTFKDNIKNELVLECKLDIDTELINEVNLWLLELDQINEIEWNNYKYKKAEGL